MMQARQKRRAANARREEAGQLAMQRLSTYSRREMKVDATVQRRSMREAEDRDRRRTASHFARATKANSVISTQAVHFAKHESIGRLRRKSVVQIFKKKVKKHYDDDEQVNWNDEQFMEKERINAALVDTNLELVLRQRINNEQDRLLQQDMLLEFDTVREQKMHSRSIAFQVWRLVAQRQVMTRLEDRILSFEAERNTATYGSAQQRHRHGGVKMLILLTIFERWGIFVKANKSGDQATFLLTMRRHLDLSGFRHLLKEGKKVSNYNEHEFFAVETTPDTKRRESVSSALSSATLEFVERQKSSLREEREETLREIRRTKKVMRKSLRRSSRPTPRFNEDEEDDAVSTLAVEDPAPECLSDDEALTLDDQKRRRRRRRRRRRELTEAEVAVKRIQQHQRARFIHASLAGSQSTVPRRRRQKSESEVLRPQSDDEEHLPSPADDRRPWTTGDVATGDVALARASMTASFPMPTCYAKSPLNALRTQDLFTHEHDKAPLSPTAPPRSRQGGRAQKISTSHRLLSSPVAAEDPRIAWIQKLSIRPHSLVLID